MIKNIFLLALICAIISSCEQSGNGLVPSTLQCEYQTEPVGMDVSAPRFEWQLHDPKHVRGQRQTAYNILVASSIKKLTEPDADVWNSGKVSSSQSVLVPFEGKKLQSGSAYYWKVMVYDKDGKPSRWSKPARFVTGVLDPAEWNVASWIRHPDAPHTKHIWFRKNIKLNAVSDGAFIHVASLGHHELYINGKKADNSVLAPALTDFQKRLFYVTYDVSKFLKRGDNTVAVWFAPGWASYDCFKLVPLLRVKADGLDAENQATLNSDASWRCAVSSSEDIRPVFSFNNNGGEIVDARNENPDWNKPGFDDSQWKNAATQDYDVELVAQDIPPSRIIETIAAKKITDLGDGKYKIDFGKNFSGWLNIRFRGLSAGDTVTIGSADDEKTMCDFNIRNFFVSSGKDGETFQNRFNYVAGRYANLEGLKQPPVLENCTAYAVSTDLKRTGHFTSSNDLFNKIYETDIWTFFANTQEGYTSDCPHRERCGYGEVATACSWGLGLPNLDAGAYYRKVVRDWCDVQMDDGWGRHTAPQPNNFHWGGAMWSSAGMNVAQHHYQHYGDRRVIETVYPTAKRWLEFLHANTKDSLLQQYRQHNKGQFLGDWLAPHSRSEFGSSVQAVYFNNCVYAMNLETFIQFAKLLGRDDDAALYGERLEKLRPAIHAKFYRGDNATYCDGTQVQNAFALLTGVTVESERAKVEAYIHDDLNGEHPYFDMGSSGLTVLLKYLVAHPEEGETTAKIMNKTTFPGYGYFIEQGENTWPEDWKIDVPSKIHTCYTGVAGWFTKGLCGIQPDSDGYSHFTIKPCIVDEVDFAEASVASPYGDIVSRWERKGSEIILSVTVPPNSSATVYIPASHPDKVTESGNLLNGAEGLTPKGFENGYAAVQAVSGKYRFVTMNNPQDE
ncbi:MAG: glycoside hydrolase family 78 protein [Prevotellaceae bacterium]|jgi:alpha-L-rhamnosidase|nr:glycoside hydrolase family 78 protein [Prevotellaceae bacterium]